MTSIPLEETVGILIKKFKCSLKDSKYRAKKKGIPFDLTFGFVRNLFVQQKGKCFYSGKPFNVNEKLNTFSLDRIDSSEGYLKSNVVWCRAGVNYLKYTRSYSEMYDTCMEIVFHRPNWQLIKDIGNGF